MFRIFQRKITVKEAAKRLVDWNTEKDRERYKAFHDDMRMRLGMPPIEWAD